MNRECDVIRQDSRSLASLVMTIFRWGSTGLAAGGHGRATKGVELVTGGPGWRPETMGSPLQRERDVI